MNNHHRLKNIATVFLEEKTDDAALTNAVKEYQSLLKELSDINLLDEGARSNIHFETGKALGTTWAAMCIDDLIRTKRFIKGIYSAIQSLQKKNKQSIHVLYAGTGPYAALILPLLSLFTEKQLQFTLLEINKISYENMLKVMSALGFNRFIYAVELADASVYKIKDPSIIDIVVTETMQHGLVKEQQVPISINLVNQLSDDVVLIPQNITLDLSLISLGKMQDNMLNDTHIEFYKNLGKIFELNAASIKGFKKDANGKFEFPVTTVPISVDAETDFDKLAILTTISVFDDNFIYINQSGLTIPLIIQDISAIRNKVAAIKMWYEIDASPGIRFEMIYKNQEQVF